MIRIVEGALGSGKTYYAMNYLLKFADYDKVYREYTLKHGYLLITNIDKVKLHHLNFDECIKKFTLEKFLTVENFETIRKKYNATHIILILDEAQKYLDYKYYNKDVMFFFEYSRHLGVDIFLISQGASKISRHILPTCEYIVKALERSKHIPGTFRYQYFDTKYSPLFTESIKHTSHVFNSYRSFTSEELTKPKSTYIKPLIFLSLAIVATVFMLVTFFSRWTKPAQAQSKNSSSRSVQDQRAQSWHSQYSSAHRAVLAPVSSAVSSASFIPVPVSSPLPHYVMVDVVGYSSNSSGQRVFLLRSGQVLPSCKVRDFDRLSLTAYVLSSDLRGGDVSTSPPQGGAAAALPPPPKVDGFTNTKPDFAPGPSGSVHLVDPGSQQVNSQHTENTQNRLNKDRSGPV